MGGTVMTGGRSGKPEFETLAELAVGAPPSEDRQRAELKRRAIALLARRDYSRAELTRKLQAVAGRLGRSSRSSRFDGASYVDGFSGASVVSRRRKAASGERNGRRGHVEALDRPDPDPSFRATTDASDPSAWPEEPGHDAFRQTAVPRVSTGLIEQVLDELESQRLLSDRRMAEALVRGSSARYGSARLEQNLQRKGLDPCLIDDVLQHLAGNEKERAREVWLRRFGRPPADIRERARQYRFLLGRGFASSVVAAVVPAAQARKGADEDVFDGESP
ncbi:MAG: regulatory protein RecX [Lautropia sp.]|nr:regulatory protein RecX [Lautropia sp.]